MENKVYTNDEQCSSIWCEVASTEHFNFSERERVLERLTLEHRELSLSMKTNKNDFIAKLHQLLLVGIAWMTFDRTFDFNLLRITRDAKSPALRQSLQSPAQA